MPLALPRQTVRVSVVDQDHHMCLGRRPVVLAAREMREDLPIERLAASDTSDQPETWRRHLGLAPPGRIVISAQLRLEEVRLCVPELVDRIAISGQADMIEDLLPEHGLLDQTATLAHGLRRLLFRAALPPQVTIFITVAVSSVFRRTIIGGHAAIVTSGTG
jgi:hypothetical protein